MSTQVLHYVHVDVHTAKTEVCISYQKYMLYMFTPILGMEYTLPFLLCGVTIKFYPNNFEFPGVSVPCMEVDS